MDDKSCVYCVYGDLVRTPAYWEFPEEFNIECNYPQVGNLGEDRDDMELLDEYDLQDAAQDCKEYTYYQEASSSIDSKPAIES